MKINQKILPKKYNDILYANDFKCKNMMSGFMPGKFYNWTNNTWESSMMFATSNLIDIEQNTYYVFSHELGSIGGAIVCFDGSGNYVSVINQDTITTPFKITNSSIKKIRVIAYDGDHDITAHEHWMQLEKGTTATPYTPYKPGIEEIYSTEEVRIGTWKGTNSIYRRIYETGALNNDGAEHTISNIGLSNVGSIIRLEAYVEHNQNQYFPLNWYNYNYNQKAYWQDIKSSDEIVYATDISTTHVTFIFEYTKN